MATTSVDKTRLAVNRDYAKAKILSDAGFFTLLSGALAVIYPSGPEMACEGVAVRA